MKKYIINGKFLSEPVLGIVRYATELTLALDKILENSVEVVLLVPSCCKKSLFLKNIKTVKYGGNSGIKWELTDLKKYLNSHLDYICINFCNVAPFGCRPGLTVVHDIMYKTFPENYKSVRNKISRIWHCLQYSYVFKHEKQIVTVSDFSKKEIEKNYPRTKGKIEVVPNGWQHVKTFKENPAWNEKYPFLNPKQYFFSLATLSKNKNGKWIIEVAKRNPNFTFAMGGKIYDEDLKDLPQNIKLLGFVPDEDVCSLMKNCKAFLFPSILEGFGIPPLEALAMGADVISSNTSSMPEVLGSSVHYINPFDYDVDLKQVLKESVMPKEETLNRFGWDKSAEKLLGILERI